MKKVVKKLPLLLFLTGLSTCPINVIAKDYPIVFTTQVPIPADFTSIGSTFGNHLASLGSTGRGGDLWIRYTDGSLKNITEAAGYGNSGFQGGSSIAVRDPAANWEGDKIIFSMAMHAPLKQYTVETYFWQLYEASSLGKNETPVIKKLINQPINYNNISPIYGNNNRIIFSSDRPLKGMAHLYPQLDEYESAPTVSGLWSLHPASGDLVMLTHSPSGDFTPIIDSYGRVIFTRWDHLQRDQQADADVISGNTSTFNWSNESPSAIVLSDRTEIFPEPRDERQDLLIATNSQRGHQFNHFFPWMVNEDGSALETLNHIGRHELHSYFDKSRDGDQNLEEFNATDPIRINQNSIENFFQIQEDPMRAGYYIGIDAPEFTTHASGQIIELNMPPMMNPGLAKITYRTHQDTKQNTASPRLNHTGHYRDPLPLSNGKIIASHTVTTIEADNIGNRSEPKSNYDFRLKYLTKSNGYLVPSEPLTKGIFKTISYWDPDFWVTYSGELWELHPVELRPRKRPSQITDILESPEATAFSEAKVNPDQFKAWLKANNLALLVSRNVTSRDSADKQQPYNLKVAGSDTQTVGSTGKIYDISHLQFFQGDLIRGSGSSTSPEAGRRVLAQLMHEGVEQKSSRVKLGLDGSMAAIVPARRALTWQLTNEQGKGVVRERNWLSFAPGEVRVCASCHGVNTSNQAKLAKPTNKPQALVTLLQQWSENLPSANVDKRCPTTVDALLTINFQCVDVQGIYYSASLRRYAPPTDTAKLLWKLEGADSHNKKKNHCAKADSDLNIHIPCVLVGGEKDYEVDLNVYNNSLDAGGFYWGLEKAIMQ